MSTRRPVRSIARAGCFMRWTWRGGDTGEAVRLRHRRLQRRPGDACRRIYEYGGALRGGFHCRASPVAGGIYAADRPAAGCRQGRGGVDGKDRGDALARDRPGRGAVGAGLFVRSEPDAASLRRGPGQPAAWIGLRLFPPPDHRFLHLALLETYEHRLLRQIAKTVSDLSLCLSCEDRISLLSLLAKQKSRLSRVTMRLGRNVVV